MRTARVSHHHNVMFLQLKASENRFSCAMVPMVENQVLAQQQREKNRVSNPIILLSFWDGSKLCGESLRIV